jgi:hypothetical protein
MSDLKLRLWCEGHGINPSVMDNMEVRMLIKEGDAVDCLQKVIKYGDPLPGQKIDHLGPADQLEFLDLFREQ